MRGEKALIYVMIKSVRFQLIKGKDYVQKV